MQTSCQVLSKNPLQLFSIYRGYQNMPFFQTKIMVLNKSQKMSHGWLHKCQKTSIYHVVHSRTSQRNIDTQILILTNITVLLYSLMVRRVDTLKYILNLYT